MGRGTILHVSNNILNHRKKKDRMHNVLILKGATRHLFFLQISCLSHFPKCSLQDHDGQLSKNELEMIHPLHELTLVGPPYPVERVPSNGSSSTWRTVSNGGFWGSVLIPSLFSILMDWVKGLVSNLQMALNWEEWLTQQKMTVAFGKTWRGWNFELKLTKWSSKETNARP